MNCIPKELAVITRVPHSDIKSTRLGLLKLIGKVVRVTSICPGSPVPTWHIEEPFFNPMEHGVYLIDRVEDWCLTPLRGCSVSEVLLARAADTRPVPARSDA
jgi:hypothetical protein